MYIKVLVGLRQTQGLFMLGVAIGSVY